MIRASLSLGLLLMLQGGMGPGPGTPASSGGGTPTVNAPGCSYGTTSASFSTTGYTFEVVAITFYPGDGTNTVTDSLGNTLSSLSVYGSGPATKLTYTTLSSTSGSTTISTTTPSVFCVFLTSGQSGVFDTGTDQGAASSVNTCQPSASSIAPGAGHVVFTALGGSSPTSTTTPTIANSGADTYTVASPFVYFVPASHFGQAGGYAILTGASNLTWTWTGMNGSNCAEASFH